MYSTSKPSAVQAIFADILQPNRDVPSVQRRMARLRRATKILDHAWRVPGTRWDFGVDSMVGLIPGVGDFATACVSGVIVLEAYRITGSRSLVWRMLGNVCIDFLVGCIPVLGDLFDVAFKSNRRNMNLLERHIQRRGR